VLQPGTSTLEKLVSSTGRGKLPELEDVLSLRLDKWQIEANARSADCCDCMSEASLEDVDSDEGGECGMMLELYSFSLAEGSGCKWNRNAPCWVQKPTSWLVLQPFGSCWG
jgi:hypothetical protein